MAEKAKKKFSLLRVLLAVIIGILAIIIIGLIIVFFPRSKIENVPSLEKSGAKSLVVYFSRDKVIDTDGVDATSSASLNIGGREYVGDVTDAAEKVAKATGSDTHRALLSAILRRNGYEGICRGKDEYAPRPCKYPR